MVKKSKSEFDTTAINAQTPSTYEKKKIEKIISNK
jgi:hypothetical protein